MKENKTLLKWSTAVFLALQLFGMMMRIKFGPRSPTNQLFYSMGPYAGQPQSNVVDNFKVLTFEIASTVAYLITLYLYARHLECFPGRIYGQGGLPMYSSNSAFFTDQRGSHHNNGHRMNMTTPFTYSFEPPPPYSSVNNLANNSTDASFVGIVGQPPQQPCSSRSVFHNIGRIGGISFKKVTQHPHRGIQNHSIIVNPENPNSSQNFPTLVTVHNDLNRNPSSNSANYNTSANPSESDSPSDPLLERRQNDLGVVSERRNHYSRSLLNLKEVE